MQSSLLISDISNLHCIAVLGDQYLIILSFLYRFHGNIIIVNYWRTYPYSEVMMIDLKPTWVLPNLFALVSIQEWQRFPAKRPWSVTPSCSTKKISAGQQQSEFFCARDVKDSFGSFLVQHVLLDSVSPQQHERSSHIKLWLIFWVVTWT